jgi:hypothetical protein
MVSLVGKCTRHPLYHTITHIALSEFNIGSFCMSLGANANNGAPFSGFLNFVRQISSRNPRIVTAATLTQNITHVHLCFQWHSKPLLHCHLENFRYFWLHSSTTSGVTLTTTMGFSNYKAATMLLKTSRPGLLQTLRQNYASRKLNTLYKSILNFVRFRTWI